MKAWRAARWLGALLLVGATVAGAAEPSAQAEVGPTAVHLLDYVGVDYPATVKDGKVIDASEYAEQVEFVDQTIRLIQKLPDNPAGPGLLAQARQLLEQVQAKADGNTVSRRADRLRWDLIQAYGLTVAPRRVPDLSGAAALYQSQCAACHGSAGRGDGPAGQGMEPAPADFHDAERMRVRSIHGLYNTLTLGVTGTAMRGYGALAEEERWALAMLVSAMRVSPGQLRAAELAWQRGEGRGVFTTLKDLVTQTPAQAVARHGIEAEALLAYLALHPQQIQAAGPVPLQLARSKLDESLQRYRQGQREAARELAVSAYLEGFELIESSLDNVDSPLRVQIEHELMALRSAIGAGQEPDAVAAQVARLQALLVRPQDTLGSASLAPATAFASALLILLREGLEAVLVLAAIIAFVRKTGRRDALAYVHAGWIAALAAGALTWWLASTLISISGAGRELTEGVTALIAAAMLLYVGYWLHGKSRAQAWQRFIREQVGTALGRRTLWAMAAVSFLAVYREIFEIILFYEALWAQSGAAGHGALLAGVGVAAVLLAVLVWAILRYSVRLPIGPFFNAAAALMALLAVVFAGNGVAALQEAGVIGANPVHFVTIPLLGLHPTLQGLVAQAAALALVVAGLLLARRRAAAP